jgi:aprataxin
MRLTERHIHLHVISSDRSSDCLKTKKHFNSFRPDLGFFIPIAEVERWIANDRRYVEERVDVSYSISQLLSDFRSS